MTELTLDSAIQLAKAFLTDKKKPKDVVEELQKIEREVKTTKGQCTFKEGLLKTETVKELMRKQKKGDVFKLLKEWDQQIKLKKNKKPKKSEEASNVEKEKMKVKSGEKPKEKSAVEILKLLKKEKPLDLVINSIVALSKDNEEAKEMILTKQKQTTTKGKKPSKGAKKTTEKVPYPCPGIKKLAPNRLVKNVKAAHAALCKMKAFKPGVNGTTAAIKDQYELIFAMQNQEVKVDNKSIVQDIKAFEKNVWKLISNISELVIYPNLTESVIEECFEDTSAVGKVLMENKLIFCFVLRNLLACLCFETVLSKAVYDTLRRKVDGKQFKWAENKNWRNAIAFVGFNRLMSPNNKAGVSISSDIDFKLVFEPSVIKHGNNNDLTNDEVEAFSKMLNGTLETWTDRFDGARLTLEVEAFTTKATTQVEEALKNFEAERNFYASMIGNHVCVAGDKDVYGTFKKTIDSYIKNKDNNFIIAKRTFDQYLGVTDKGSIQVIKEFTAFKGVVDACTKSKAMITFKKAIQKKEENKKKTEKDVVVYESLFYELIGLQKDAFDELLDKHNGDNNNGDRKRRELEKRSWLAIPKVFYLLMKEDELVEKLVNEQDVGDQLTEIGKLPLFKSMKADKKKILKLVAKLIKGISAGSPEFHRPQVSDYAVVGSKIPKAGKGWCYNIKYSGCRLSDFYDAVTLEDYKKWNKSKGSEKLYQNGRKIAVAINKFSLEMQSAIYMNAATQILPPTHADIDNLYARMTSEEFNEVLQKSRQKDSPVDILPALQNLIKQLEQEKQTKVPNLAKKLVSHLKQKEIEALASITVTEVSKQSTTVVTQQEKDSLTFFKALFELADETAKGLKPSAPKKQK